MSAPEGWYPDPAGSPHLRWFDGAQWTAHLRPGAPPDVITAGPEPGWERTTRVPLWRRAAVLAVAAAVLLAAVGTVLILRRSTPSTATATTAATSPAPSAAASSPATGATAAAGTRPRVGDCHGYGYTAMQRPTDPAPTVSCTGGTATAMTFAVLPVPAGAKLPFDTNPATVQAAGRICQSQLDTYLGGGPALQISRLSLAFFEPTTAQVTAGQQWVRCDVYLSGVTTTGAPTLAPLPHGALQGTLAGAGAWTYAWCVQATGRNSAAWLTTVDCRSSGAQVAVVPVPVATTGAPYPGAAKAAATAAHVCAVVSGWYGGLPLRGVAEPAKAWDGSAMCLATPGEFRSWLASGRPFTGPQAATSA